MATNIVFPDDVGCWEIDSFTDTSSKSIKQLGNNAIKSERSSIQASMLIGNDDKVSKLWAWWNIELQQGRLPFLVDLAYYSDTPSSLEVQFSTKLEINKIGKKYKASVTMLINPELDEILSKSVLPTAIIDLDATDDQDEQITITFTDSSEGVVFYDLYTTGDVLIAASINSGYVDFYIGTRDYYVKSYNPKGEVQSNTDSGTGTTLQPPQALACTMVNVGYQNGGITTESGKFVEFNGNVGGSTPQLWDADLTSRTAMGGNRGDAASLNGFIYTFSSLGIVYKYNEATGVLDTSVDLAALYGLGSGQMGRVSVSDGFVLIGQFDSFGFSWDGSAYRGGILLAESDLSFIRIYGENFTGATGQFDTVWTVKGKFLTTYSGGNATNIKIRDEFMTVEAQLPCPAGVNSRHGNYLYDMFGTGADSRFALVAGDLCTNNNGGVASNPYTAMLWAVTIYDGDFNIVKYITSPLNNSNNSCLGSGLSFYGDYLIIGESFADDSKTNSGALHIFDMDGEFMETFSHSTPVASTNYLYFGAGVHISANIIGSFSSYNNFNMRRCTYTIPTQ